MSKGTSAYPLKMAKELTNEVNKAWEDGSFYESVSPVTQDLLRFWFYPSFCDIRDINFHEGQKQAILNVIYLHEVLGVKNVKDLYLKTDPEILKGIDSVKLEQDKYQHPMYAVKMATGTGKTWVMHALLIWQYLNASDTLINGPFSKNFLLVAPGLIVYNRLLDAFLGKENENGIRDFEKSDFKKFEDLFIPDAYKDKVFGFLQSSVAKKEEISSKVTGDGLIAITNWHLLSGSQEDGEVDNPLDNPHQVLKNVLPISPGTTGGNELSSLDSNFIKGGEIEYLSELENLVVFNDEAHHIHEFKRGGEVFEVEWQKSLNKISETKSGEFIQIDFSATPYSSSTGKNKIKHYFPHIIVDFDLKTAIHHGLVKMIAIDKRQEIASIKNLDYKAERDGNKVIGLSEGQRLMLRAGYTKLKILEKEFTNFDENKHPKMLVICEDTKVAPFVTEFFKSEGLSEEEIVEIHSNRQGEVKDWDSVKQRLFNIDDYVNPKIVVSVLMLREGFDVNNICVIVPLRSTASDILLEQTIGRGLRLMWRSWEYEDIKAESRHKLLIEKLEPDNYLDLLSIVEHPKFIEFYDNLDEIPIIVEGGDGPKGALGDMISVGLRENYEKYDFYWPIIIQESEEILNNEKLSIENLEVYPTPLSDLQRIKGEGGEKFISREITVRTQFGEYRVTADIFNAESYNEFLSKIVGNVNSMIQNVGRTSKEFPMMQVNNAKLMGLIDNYIRQKLFDEPFNPMENENWRILLMSENSIINHIVKQISKLIYEMQTNVDVTEAIVHKIKFSIIDELRMREKYSIPIVKSIYERLSYPSHGGGLEKAFIESLDNDGKVQSFLKINEYYHTFAAITYIREDGLLARYFPDFIVKIGNDIYIVETKADKDINSPNVQRKRIATLDALDKINQLKGEDRMDAKWNYVLLGQNTFESMHNNGASIKEILDYAIVNEAKAKGYSTLDNF
ncbi:DEAD/DEAH box helicase family protein [uncultured Methanobrevibacter sp.]|uniref:DEAD/DEAH box helicase family protein n=1 Tax=uncultured Methanobrevibacter sp. TaxID=253161 RepID=UPI00260BC9C5|nr:DEAD/DEAH box helicase family protein [uncultured Methanobrevibacter sp.]